MKFVFALLTILSLQVHADVRHFVAFRYKPSVTVAQRTEVGTRFLALAQACHKPDGTPYVLSIEAGDADSPEGVDQGMQDGYLVTFKTTADRDYYVGQPFFTAFDPAHADFKAFVGPLLDTNGLFIFDFVN